MLVLSRKVGEKVVIGQSVTLVVKRITGQRVILGVEAPLDMSIVRAELKRLPEVERTPEVRVKETLPAGSLQPSALSVVASEAKLAAATFVSAQ